MTYEEKLSEIRNDISLMVKLLLAADEDKAAAEVIPALTAVNHARDQLADLGLDDEPWVTTKASAVSESAEVSKCGE